MTVGSNLDVKLVLELLEILVSRTKQGLDPLVWNRNLHEGGRSWHASSQQSLPCAPSAGQGGASVATCRDAVHVAASDRPSRAIPPSNRQLPLSSETP